METWDEMRARHMRERVELVESLAQSRYTQTQASKILHMKLSALNNFVRRNQIYWPVIQQGKKSDKEPKITVS
jgi:transcriptional regulator with GAF, ATPase, and Fis domain